MESYLELEKRLYLDVSRFLEKARTEKFVLSSLVPLITKSLTVATVSYSEIRSFQGSRLVQRVFPATADNLRSVCPCSGINGERPRMCLGVKDNQKKIITFETKQSHN